MTMHASHNLPTSECASALSSALRMVALATVVQLLLPLHAPAEIEIDFNNPHQAKMPIAVANLATDGPGPLQGEALANIIRNDFYLTGLFRIVDSSSAASPAGLGDPDFILWEKTGASALILGSFTVSGGELVLQLRLFDVALKRQELGKRFTGRVGDHRRMIHRFCDLVLEKLTSIPGCFSTQIAFISDTQRREVHSMDFDGFALRQVTATGSITMSPDWSPDGRSLLFTGYRRGNPDLWSIDLATLRESVISARQGLNASGRYSPFGDRIALSLSFKGTPKIFIINPQGHIINMLTHGKGNDISPTWSPDGSTIAFVSDQAGTPQIYLTPVSSGVPAPPAGETGSFGQEAQAFQGGAQAAAIRPIRLTVGSAYSTDPKWSPRGDLLAFVARIDGRFQICTVRPNGADLRVLTQEGSNEEPSWSPDGRMIAFTRNRQGKRQIFVMDARGEIQQPVSPIPGKAPAWSPRLWR